MRFNIHRSGAPSPKADVLFLPVFEGELDPRTPESTLQLLPSVDAALPERVARLASQEAFKAKADQTLVVQCERRAPFERVVLLGLGARPKFSPETLRLALGRGAKAAARFRAESASVALPVARDPEATVRATIEGLVLGAYKFDRWKSATPEERAAPRLERVTLVPLAGQPQRAGWSQAVELGLRVAEATNWARDLVNEPAAVLTPRALAARAVAMAKAAGLEVSVADERRIRALKMGMFLAVARGSVEPPRLIELSYVPKSAAAARRSPLCLVGKAITFDSGGLSLKPSESMVDMKTDMAGAAAVLGAMQVIAHLAPPFPVHAFMGACENMPSGNAYRLGDVLVSRIGKTVEITNTDAEGRLVLGDVLAYANERKPALLVDLATLTGACMIALGHFVAGAFGDDDQAMWNVLAAAKAAGEELWRLPIHELQKDALKSEVADLKNSGERWGGAINAAVFLKEFVGATPWVHLDIAGPSQSPKERGYASKGATGFGVRTLVELVRRLGRQHEAAEAQAANDDAARPRRGAARHTRAQPKRPRGTGRREPASGL